MFILDGVEKLINYKITVKNGYSVYTDIEPSESINLESLVYVPAIEADYHKAPRNNSELLSLDNDELQWTTMDDGILFYQKYMMEKIINGSYTLKTSDEKLHTINYTITPFKNNITSDSGKSDFNNEDKYNTDKPAFNINCELNL